MPRFGHPPYVRLPENEDKRWDIITKVIFVIFVFFLFILVPGIFGSKSKAIYSEGQGPQTASVQQTLRLVIPPALEFQTIGQKTESEGFNEITVSESVSLRANTAWQVEVSGESSFQSQPSCYAQGASGQRNRDNSAQIFGVACEQEVSWADDLEGEELQLRYSVSPVLSE
jgi:hypothetical protein